MDYIEVRSIGGSLWTFRKDRIEMVSQRFTFTEDELKAVPKLREKKSCAIIQLIDRGDQFFCDDTYESIIKRLNEK